MPKSRRSRAPSKTDLLALEADEAKSRLASLQALVRSQKRAIARLHKAHGEALEFNDDLLAALVQLPALSHPRPLRAPARGTEVALVALVGDWQIGERIDFEEMDGFNEFNWAIAQKRVKLYRDSVLRWLAIQRKGYVIRRLYVPVLGDMIHGEIHPEEYLPTNEFRTPEQTARAGQLLADFVAPLCAEFDEVVMDLLGADNHARRTLRHASKEAAMNSFNYLIYEIARGILSNQKNLTMRFHVPLKAQVEIEGRSVLLSHGHETKAWMGIPHYGIERAEGREARKRMKKGRPYTLHIMGHWHIYAELPGYILNGSLCGASEYDAKSGRFAEPSQTTFLMHGEHGHFNTIAWRL